MFFFDPGAVVASISGLGLLALGIMVAGISRRRDAVAFSAFAIAWGLQVAASNLNGITDSIPATSLDPIIVSAALVLPAALIVFVTRLLRPTAPWVLEISFGLLTAVALIWFFSAPASLAPGTLAGDSLLFGANVTVFAGVLLALGVVTLRRPPRVRAHTVALVTAALLVYVSYRGAFLAAALLGGATPAQYGLALVTVGVAMVGVALGVWSGRFDPASRTLLVTCAVFPAVGGVLDEVAFSTGFTAFTTVGLWRLVMVALFAYAIARHRMFDLDLRLRNVAPAAVYVVLTMVGVGVLWWNLRGPFTRAPFLGVTASVGLAMVAFPSIRLGERALTRLAPHVGEPDYLYRRKLEVYRAALEESRARDGGAEDDAFLAALRKDLGISVKEHRVLALVLEGKPVPVPVSGTRFRVERELGRGASGRAVLAHDTKLDRPVVLKEPLFDLDASQRALFLQEARVAARVRHPNVVAVHDVIDAPEGAPVLVLEYVEGGSLGDMIRGGRKLAPAQAVALTRDVLAGLAAIHAAGIVHRDVKPDNVLVDRDGRAKVTDFGVARAPAEVALAATLGATSWQPGSLQWMSPEQARGEAVDARTDVFAAGAILYRMLTGRNHVVLTGRSEAEARRMIAEARPAVPSEVPPALAVVLERALAAEPGARYASAAEMAAALPA